MHVLVLSGGQRLVTEAQSTTAAANAEFQKQIAQGGQASKVSAYPGVVTLLVKEIEKNADTVVYRGVSCGVSHEVTFTDIDGMLFHPYADTGPEGVTLQLIAPDGRVTPFGEAYTR